MLLGSQIPFYNTMGTASVTFNQYAFTNISCAHLHILDCLVFNVVKILLHQGNGFYNLAFVLFQFL